MIHVCIPAPSSPCVHTLDLSRSGERLQFTIVFETYQGHVSVLRSICNSVFIYTFILEAIRCAWTSVNPFIRRQIFMRSFFIRSVGWPVSLETIRYAWTSISPPSRLYVGIGSSDLSSVCSFVLNCRYILIKL